MEASDLAERLAAPVLGLASAWLPKLTTSALLVWVLEVLRATSSVYAEVLNTDAALVALIGLLIVLDTVTGVTAALRRGARIRSHLLRRTVVKVVEYSAVGYASVAVSNAFARGPLAGMVSAFDDAVLLYIALTEVYSIAENVWGEGGARRVLDWVASVRRGEAPPPPAPRP
jgi:hypothetical protein